MVPELCTREDHCLEGRGGVRRGQVELRAQTLDLAAPQHGLERVACGPTCFLLCEVGMSL